MHISQHEKNVFIHFCIDINDVIYELIHTVLLIVVVMT